MYPWSSRYEAAGATATPHSHFILTFHHIYSSSTLLSDLIKSNMKGGMAQLTEILFLATGVLLEVDDAGSVTNPSVLWTVVAKRY